MPEFGQTFCSVLGFSVLDNVFFLFGACEDGLNNTQNRTFEFFDGEDEFIFIFGVGLLGEGHYG